MFRQSGRDRSQQKESAVAPPAGIDGAAQAGEQFRPGLRLVQNNQLARGDEFVPLKIEAQTVRGLLQIEVNPGKGAGQRCLAGLTGTDEDGGGVGLEALAKQRFDDSCDHVKIETYF
jgi:hypothetical protein